MPVYAVKKVASKKWDVLRDGAAWVPGFPVLGLANLTRDKFNQVDGAQPAPAPTPTPAPAPTPSVLFNKALFDKIVGPTMSPEAITACAGYAAAWVANFNKHIERHWTETGYGEGNTFGANYYDRANIYDAWYKMGGYANQTYLDRANKIATYYRDSYVIAGNYQVPPYNWMAKGIALHCAARGDETSRLTLGRVSDGLAMEGTYWLGGVGNREARWHDNRVNARVLESMVLCALTDAPSLGNPQMGWPGGNDWHAKARKCLNQLMAGQEVDGTWRHVAQEYGLQPFMTGLLLDALIFYFQAYEADPRIPPAVQKCAECLWSTVSPKSGLIMWVPRPASGFRYLEYPTALDGAHTGPVPDLNGLLINAYSFVAQQTGSTVWKARANDILEGMAIGGLGADEWLYLGKQFNQSYTHSYKTFPMLYGG